MVRKQFVIKIAAPKEKVWDVLWSDEGYRAWTAVFSEGSKVETDWNKGSKVLFMDAKNSGIVSTIAEKIPNEYMSFRHLGEIKGGVEDLESESVKGWSGAMEKYILTERNNETELLVEMDILESHLDYFLKVWPQALEKVKELAI